MCNDQQEFIMDEAIWRISELGMNNTSVNVSSLATPLVHWSTGPLVHSTRYTQPSLAITTTESQGQGGHMSLNIYIESGKYMTQF